MASISEIFRQIGQSLKGGAVKPKSTSQNGLPPFDFNQYIQAWKIFLKDFFGRQVPEFFKNPKPHLQNFPTWWKAEKQDEQMAYGGVLIGSCMIVIGIVLIFAV